MKVPDFSTWSRENLEQLCQELYVELHHLRVDVKTAIQAYRDLNKSKGNYNEKTNHSNECGK